MRSTDNVYEVNLRAVNPSKTWTAVVRWRWTQPRKLGGQRNDLNRQPKSG